MSSLFVVTLDSKSVVLRVLLLLRGNLQLLVMVHNLWCTSLECHNLAQVILHLRHRIHLGSDAVKNIVSFLKLPELNIVAGTETSAYIRFAFWNSLCRPFDFLPDEFPVGVDEGWLIACDFNFQFLAFNWSLSRDHHYTVKVLSMDQQQDITDVIEPSAAFTYDGMEFAVPVFVSGNGCIVLYDVSDDANSLLNNRREISFPKQFCYDFICEHMPMTFSPSGETLALAGSGKVFFIDVIGGTFGGWTQSYHDFDILALQYSPDGHFVVAAGNDLNSDYDIRFDGFIYIFNEHGRSLLRLSSSGAGERLPGINNLAFSTCSTKVACVASYMAEVYIVDVNSGHAHLLTMADSVDAVVFDPSGQQLVVAHGSSICIIDTMSGTKLHETPFFDSSLKIEAMSWPEDKKQI